jgi:dodecin
MGTYRGGIASATPRRKAKTLRRNDMPQSVYNVIELIGTSPKSWAEAAKAAVERATATLRDLRVAEVVEQDVMIKDGKVEAYRTKIKVSFKHKGHDWT